MARAQVVRAGVGLLVFVLLLLTPAAAARELGALVAEGDLSFPGGSTLRFVPTALLQNATPLAPGVLTADMVRLAVFEDSYTEVGLPGLWHQSGQGLRETREVLRDVEIAWEPSDEKGGFVGFVLEGSEAEATFVPLHDVALAPRERTDWSTRTGAKVDVGSEREDRHFGATLDAPHFVAAAQGELTHSGGGTLKVSGPALVLRTPEGTRRIETGFERESDAPLHSATWRWVVLEFEAGALASTGRWDLAAQQMAASWDGTASLRPVAGGLQAEGREYVATGALARLEGAFDAVLTPFSGPARQLLTRMDVRGDLASTTLRAQALASSPVPAAPIGAVLAPLAVGLAVAAGAAGGYGGAWVRRRGRSRAGFSLAECQDAGAAAAAAGDWEEAAEWLGRARLLAPGDARLASDLALAWSMAGRHDEALALYETASRLSSDGEAEANGALAAARAGRSVEEVERWVVRALCRDPGRARDLDGAEELAPLAGRPVFEEAMALAWRGAGHGR